MAITRRTPSGDITATRCRPSGENDTLLIAGRRPKAEAAGSSFVCAQTRLEVKAPHEINAADINTMNFRRIFLVHPIL